ncbi:MAG: PIN domain-containing protein [Gammaproteobacteria bacterium]|nr:MAG: PIN domain-containing protein [Gammaproteobacteria bacterium]
MSDSKVFLDTNLLVYLYSNDPKSQIIEKLVSEQFEKIVISTQVLSELYNVFIKKKIKSPEETQQVVNDLIEAFSITILNEKTIQKAISINHKYKFSYWDSLIISAAIDAECTKIYTEDMQHLQLIESRITLINPFIHD